MTFAPSTCHIYDYSIPYDTLGFPTVTPLHPSGSRLICGSCSSGQSFACSFLPTPPRDDAVAVQLGVPGHKGPQRTFTSKSLPGLLSLAGSLGSLIDSSESFDGTASTRNRAPIRSREMLLHTDRRRRAMPGARHITPGRAGGLNLWTARSGWYVSRSIARRC